MRGNLLAILLLGLPVMAQAAQPATDAPKRKAGLWEQKVTMSAPAARTTTMTMCTDGKTDNLIAQRAETSQRCESQSVRREGNNVVVEAVCREGTTTIRTRGTFSGDFNNTYRGEIKSTFEPPMHGMKELTQTIEGRYVGPCKPGQKPGDVAVEGMGGMNMNLNEMMKGDPAKMQEMMRQMQQQYQGKGRPAQ